MNIDKTLISHENEQEIGRINISVGENIHVVGYGWMSDIEYLNNSIYKENNGKYKNFFHNENIPYEIIVNGKKVDNIKFVKREFVTPKLSNEVPKYKIFLESK